MKRVLIKYKFTTIGMFFNKQYDGSVIEEMKEGETVSDVVDRWSKETADMTKTKPIIVSIVDYKVIE